MNTITIKTTPPDLMDRLRNSGKTFPQAIAKEMDRQNQLTVGHITERRMTGKGPFPASEHKMGVRTNAMRRTLRASRAVVRGGVIESAIGSNLSYMGAHEFGFSGSVNVRAHNRRNKAGNVRGRLEPGQRKKLLAVGFQTVKAHARKINVPARAPIYHGILDRADAIGAGLSRAILKELGEA